MAMSERTFGVEIECGHPGGHYGVRQALSGGGFKKWARTGMDGSGVEVRSPILKGEDGIEELKKVMEFLKDLGCYVTTRDGMHVHHGGADYIGDRPAIVRLVRSWYANQKLINKMVAPSRRTRGYGRPWTKAEVDLLATSPYYRGERTRALNVQSLSRHRTIEIRQFQGCLDGDVAEAWVLFGQRFIDNVKNRKRAMATCATPEIVLKRVKAPKAADLLTVYGPKDNRRVQGYW